jgi:nucleotide-binding universal stress UspA family protein
MIRLKNILVPTDFSETSEAAVKYGVALARAFNARLHLLNVPDHPGETPEVEYPIGLFETLQNAAHDRLGAMLSERDNAELQPIRVMRVGRTYNEIVRYAQEQNIDLIVMGTHGREGLTRVVLGSVAERVVRKAPCPVLTVHHPEHEFVLPDDAAEKATAAL